MTVTIQSRTAANRATISGKRTGRHVDFRMIFVGLHNLMFVLLFSLQPLTGYSDECQQLDLARISANLGDAVRKSDHLAQVKSMGNITKDEVETIRELIRLNWAENFLYFGDRLSWVEFESIETLISKIRSGPIFSKSQFWNSLAVDLDRDGKLSAQRTLMQETVINGPWKPMEYEMRVSYFRRVMELNSLLPPELQKPLPQLMETDRFNSLKETERQTIQGIEERSDRSFSTSGFVSPSALKAALDQSDPATRKIGEIFASGELNFAMRAPGNARWWIEKAGFQNQHVTGTGLIGKGNGPDDTRDSWESKMLGMNIDAFRIQDPESKQHYGYIEFQQHFPPKGKVFLAAYGDDIYVFKSAIRERTSMTLGDSLGLVDSNYELSQRIASDAKNGQPIFWQGLIIPWKNRILAAPFVSGSADAGGYSLEKHASLPHEKFNYYENEYGIVPYIEAQAYGPLRLTDVAEFRFTKEPPSTYFLKALIENNVKIMDARNGEHLMVEWKKGN
jgi:hypothetical protein